LTNEKKKTTCFSISNDELERCQIIVEGDFILCKKCGGGHDVSGGIDGNGRPSAVILSYLCGDTLFMAGLNGKNITGNLETRHGVK
jgi:hypothetical protein